MHNPRISLNRTPSAGCFITQRHSRHRRPSVQRSRAPLLVTATAQADKTSAESSDIRIENDKDTQATLITLQCANRAGLLSALTTTFADLGLDVVRAQVGSCESGVQDQFWVTLTDGSKVPESQVSTIVNALEVTISNTNRCDSRPALNVPGAPAERGQLLYTLMDTYIKNDVLSIQQSIVHHVEYTLARSRYKFDDLEAYMATAYSVRDRLIESWNDTQSYFKQADPKRVYYMSMEFLMGRSLLNALWNLGVKDQYAEALTELGYKLEILVDKERDAALGNGGLGRLAACFLDSMASLNLPAWGYGIRYQYGMFRQVLVDGFQHEQPDYWLNFGNPWELERSASVAYPISFYGHVSVHDENGRQVFRWNPVETVTAVAYDNPIPGFDTKNTINLRLWAAKPDREFDLQAFNTGDYVQAILSKQRAETLSSVLYPDDRTYEGKELRLKQQHFFVSATVQDVVRRYKEAHPEGWDSFGEKVAFQMNDTHPTLLVPELMRVLMDQEGLGWTKAWDLVTDVCNFTNHTVLPEALERWPVAMMEKLLPRHMQIIFDINWRFLQQVRSKIGDDWQKIAALSIVEETASGEKFVRMASLAVVASKFVNGVAAIHSDILRHDVFKTFADIFPEKFQNKTNGVTPRRWLAFCNPKLRKLISSTLGNESWINDLDQLVALRDKVDDPQLQAEWRKVKAENKETAINFIEKLSGVSLPNKGALLDVQVKRIHEYKRQLMNILSIIHRYDAIRGMSPEERKSVVPRIVVIGGKAAPGYEMAKRIIKLVSAVAERINNDPAIGDLLKVAFVPDYNVSVAEVIIPGTELSQQISTAGTEASGTGNMKFAMNGALIIGTMDGANIEIAHEIGEENMFIFGARAEQVPGLRRERGNMKLDPRFERVVGMIRSGEFGWEDYFAPLVDSITFSDYYLLAVDFASYLETQAKVDEVYKDQEKWTKMSIFSTAGSGFFSSDRTIREYAGEIWGVEPCVVPVE